MEKSVQESKINLKADIFASDLTDLQNKLVYIMNETKAVQYDECTGNYLVQYGRVTAVCSELEAKAHFRTMFMSHCYIKKVDNSTGTPKTVVEKVTRDMLNDIFMVAGRVIIFNSRIDFYNAIPKWDGVPRIDGFMMKLYECDANPNFFRLFLTSVLGKIKDPKNTYVPFFFDFVGNKGVGKSYLCPTLFGEDLVQILQPCSRPEDIYTQVYQFGAVIGIDDELKITGEKAQKKLHSWTNDELKAFVTCTKDTFSRKGMQLESHPRAFVFVRTSNEVRVSTEPDERRQIIFESKLPALECRLADYDRDYYNQVLAEAKEYLEANGVYKLTREDWESMRTQQGRYVDTEKVPSRLISKFMSLQINRIQNCSSQLSLKMRDGLYVVTWEDFCDYCTNDLNMREDQVWNGRKFWFYMDEYNIKTSRIRKATGYFPGEKHDKTFAYILAESV